MAVEELGDKESIKKKGRRKYQVTLIRQGHTSEIEIVEVETGYMKNRDKGIGLKVTVRKLDRHKSLS